MRGQLIVAKMFRKTNSTLSGLGVGSEEGDSARGDFKCL